jgi:hypothetical protein
MNTIGETGKSIVWFPNLIFDNSPTGFYIKNDPLSSLSVKSNGMPVSKFDFQFQEFEEFQGISNPLLFKSNYELKLGCDFDLHLYPFDHQKCFITVNMYFYLPFYFNLVLSIVCAPQVP